MSNDPSLSMKLAMKTEECTQLRKKLRDSDKMFRGIIRQLEALLDEAGIPWRDRLNAGGDDG